jgi:hypothetical protein
MIQSLIAIHAIPKHEWGNAKNIEARIDPRNSSYQWVRKRGQIILECPVIFVPVLVRETVGKGAEDGEGKEAYA